MPDTWITDEMRALEGAELGSSESLPISASDIRKWAQALYFPTPPPRHYWDEAYAATTPYGGLVAPEEFNPFAWMTAAGPPARTNTFDVGEGGGTSVEGGFGIEAPDTKFILNGGMECTYGVRMRPGDVITSTARHAGYSERKGRLGLMLFTYSESEWLNQNGELVKRVLSTGIRY